MDAMQCKRCGKETLIPTHQHVKFDLEVQYLCEPCWEAFRQWFHTGRRNPVPLKKAA